jgi:hypothetical protein
MTRDEHRSPPSKPTPRRLWGNRCTHCGCSPTSPCLVHITQGEWVRLPERTEARLHGYTPGICGNTDCAIKEDKRAHPVQSQ